MLGLGAGVYENVIEVDDVPGCELLFENFSHEGLHCDGCSSESKWHYQPLDNTYTGE